MKPTQIYELTLPANGVVELRVAGEYFKIMSATGAVTVRGDWGQLDKLLPGQGLEDSPFKGLLLTDASGAANAVRVLVGDEKFVDGMGGAVAVSATTVARSGAFTSTAVSVGTSSAQITAANAGRQYLLIQNKSATASAWINFGAAASQAGCIRLVPGGVFELATVLTVQSIHAIADAAATALVIVEG